ncbi:MAG: Type secretion system protein [Verrucomicrobiota bacterium]|jgi:type II secretion system protein J
MNPRRRQPLTSVHAATRGAARRRLSASGFTLLELLLATAVGAIVLLVINATFFSALRLHNTTHEKIDRDLVVQRALGIIRKDLAGLMLPPAVSQAANPPTRLAGQLSTETNTATDLDNSAERITPDLTTSSAQIVGWTPFSEVQAVSYYLRAAADGGPTKDLVRLATRNLLPASEATSDARTLLTGVIAAGISYLDGDSWADSWDSATTSTLPSAIKFSLVLAPLGGLGLRTDPAPTEIVVPIFVTTQTSAQLAAEAATANTIPGL